MHGFIQEVSVYVLYIQINDLLEVNLPNIQSGYEEIEFRKKIVSVHALFNCPSISGKKRFIVLVPSCTCSYVELFD